MAELLQIVGLLLGAITLILLLISRLKWHPAIALLAVSMIAGLIIGLGFTNSLLAIWQGFYNVVIGIGLIILLGSVLGSLMESSGSLSAITGLTLKVLGQKRPITAISVLGFFVGIPVFCDSGFIILSKVAKEIADKNNLKRGATSIALAGGLYTTHTLIPPTPGPIAAAANLQMSNELGFVMISGLLVSIPVGIVLIFVSNKLFKQVNNNIAQSETHGFNNNYTLLLPVLLALGLIALGSLSNFVTFNAYAKSIISIVSHPVAALGLACVLAFLQSKNYKNSTFITFKGIEQSIPIILITGAGGAFGQILKQSELSTILQSTFDTDYTALGLVFTAYVMAMIIKTAQGSSTAALVIASSIIFPLVAPFELNTWQLAVIVSTIGCGAMAVSHANDSYFWVVTKFSDFTVNEGYKKYSLMTLLLSITGLVSCLILFTLVS